MLSQLDKFFTVVLIGVAAMKPLHEVKEAVMAGNWVLAVICVVSAVYIGWLALALIKHFFPEQNSPVK